jgi:hypothetical protein
VKESKNRGQTALFALDGRVFSGGCGARKGVSVPDFSILHPYSRDQDGDYRATTRSALHLNRALLTAYNAGHGRESQPASDELGRVERSNIFTLRVRQKPPLVNVAAPVYSFLGGYALAQQCPTPYRRSRACPAFPSLADIIRVEHLRPASRAGKRVSLGGK